MNTFALKPTLRRLPARKPWLHAWAGDLLHASCLACFLAVQTAGRGAESPSETTPFRFGFSSGMLANVNHNDAKAAVRVWSQIVAKERDIPADPEPNIREGAEAIVAGMRAQELDAIALSLREYRRVIQDEAVSGVFVAVQAGRTNVEYLLLVRQDSPCKTLADLRGKNLSCYENHITSLALPWLDTLLLQQGFLPAVAFFGQVKPHTKLSSAVLPVFFRQTDACLVHARGFEIMCELNPQVGKQLKTLAVSPALVPSIFCMRASYRPSIRDKVLDALAQLHLSPAGQQVLTVFQFDRLQRADTFCLRSGLELLAAHDRLQHGGKVAKSMNPEPVGVSTKPMAEGSR